MKTNQLDDSLALHTDFYQINMMYTYFKQGIHTRKAVFEAYFRKQPFGSGYTVFAGLEAIVKYLEGLKFTKTDLEFLEPMGYEPEFINYLKEFRFKGTLKSVKEGEIVFANEPLVIVEGTVSECQLVETAILNIINYQTLIATKASQIRHAVGQDEAIAEFGSRRAHEFDAAIWGTRAAIIGGFDSTSNVRAGKIFNIPVSGTHAHAMVQMYRDEYQAFRAYAETHRSCVFLVDTYDTLKSGVPNAIRVAKEMGDNIEFIGIRLDSGKLAYLSKEVRIMLDEAGFREAKIFASNDLDEHAILSLKKQGAKIDAWGIGTKLITSYDQPALGAVYKMVSIEDENGIMQDTIKISEIPEKVTTPGLKTVYRVLNKENQKWEGDYIAMKDENLAERPTLTMFHPVHTFIRKYVTDYEALKLHEVIFENGVLQLELPSVQEIQAYHQERLRYLWDDYKHSEEDAAYPVDLSQACYNNKMKRIHEVREQLEDLQCN